MASPHADGVSQQRSPPESSRNKLSDQSMAQNTIVGDQHDVILEKAEEEDDDRRT